MNDKTTEAKNKVQFVLQKIYIKDLSFESPQPIEFFTALKEPPEINLQLNTETQKVSADVYEIVISITVNAKPKNSDKTMYLVEVKQAGLFTLGNFPQQELTQIMHTYCLNILFPYARETVSAVVERGGFPQLLLAPINFDALYQEHVNRLKATAKAPTHAKH
ncbi:MAG TPA: protein-export chaperone SecB [Gammaproteobacteria bacterium]